jgi:hypothetical protein
LGSQCSTKPIAEKARQSKFERDSRKHMEAFVESYRAALGSLGGDRRDGGDPPTAKMLPTGPERPKYPEKSLPDNNS